LLIQPGRTTTLARVRCSLQLSRHVNLGLQQAAANDRVAELAVFLKLREDIVGRVAKHDPELAFAPN